MQRAHVCCGLDGTPWTGLSSNETSAGSRGVNNNTATADGPHNPKEEVLFTTIHPPGTYAFFSHSKADGRCPTHGGVRFFEGGCHTQTRTRTVT